MEEILINVDSRYRDIIQYPNECKFRYNLEKCYKNIISVRMVSLELNNSINYVDSQKKNNFLKLHLPNKLNDPEGIIIQLEDGLLQLVGSIQNLVNSIFNSFVNTNGALQINSLDGKPYAEKFFYVFYLNEDLIIDFDFNSIPDIQPSTLKEKLVINMGWYSLYGLVNIIKNYINNKYKERKDFISNNIDQVTPIQLDNGNFSLGETIIKVYDRRFRNLSDNKEPTEKDCVREDQITTKSFTSSNLSTNLSELKKYIYSKYVSDLNDFIPKISGIGILDKLFANKYIIPPTYIGANGTNTYNSSSIYYINNKPQEPTNDSSQIYNMLMQVDLTSLRVSFTNSFMINSSSPNTINYYYYNTNKDGTYNSNSWDIQNPLNLVQTNTILNLTSKSYLRNERFITINQFFNQNFQPSLVKDIPEFQIDFNTYDELLNPIINGIIDIKRLQYPPLGYYLGFRPNISKPTDKFLLKPSINGMQVKMTATKSFDTIGDNYLFLKVNDWGYFDFFNQKVFAKVLLTSGLGNPRLDDYINKEYKFRQPINIQKFDIELIDYLGNTVDLNGFNFSFTLELRQLVNSDQKALIERQNLVFVK